MSSTALPMAVIWSSFLPVKLHPNQRNEFNDDKSMWKNAGSIRVFFERSNTEIPSILTWLNGLFRSAFETVFIVFVASSKWIIQLHIFSVFNILKMKYRRMEQLFVTNSMGWKENGLIYIHVNTERKWLT